MPLRKVSSFSTEAPIMPPQFLDRRDFCVISSKRKVPVPL